MQKEASLGFGSASSKELEKAHEETEALAREALRNFMKPELIARFDDVVVFNALTRKEVGKIFDLLVDDVRVRLHHKGLGLVVESPAKRWLIDKGFDEKNGVRPLRRVIQDEMEHLIAEGLLDERWESGDILTIHLNHGMLDVRGAHDAITKTVHSTTSTSA